MASGRISRFSHKWVYGQRSELIFQQNGVLFWIAGDQYDGIGETELWNLAQSFRTISFNRYGILRSEMPNVTQANLGDLLDPFSQEIVRIFPDDNPGSAYYLSVSSDPSTTPLTLDGSARSLIPDTRSLIWFLSEEQMHVMACYKSLCPMHSYLTVTYFLM